jgi:hypothetical protein
LSPPNAGNAVQEVNKIADSILQKIDLNTFKVQSIKADHLAKNKPFYSLHLNIMEYIIDQTPKML